jgi:hypothetical protein
VAFDASLPGSLSALVSSTLTRTRTTPASSADSLLSLRSPSPLHSLRSHTGPALAAPRFLRLCR